MSRASGVIGLALPLLLAAAPAFGAKKKPAPKPAPVAPAEPEPPKPESRKKEEEKKAKPRVELAVCPPESLSEMEPAALVSFVRKSCRKLKSSEGAAPVDIGEHESLVVVCVQPQGEGESPPEALEAKSCNLEAAVEREGAPPHALVPDGDLALVLRTSRLSASHGARLVLVASSGGDGETKVLRASLRYSKTVEPYGGGLYVWLPLPMFTTDFSASPHGYRFGITPLAVAAGVKIHPGTSRAYFGVSGFVAWNLLVPNDTQTLSNGTGVRINYKAMGAGVLLDGAGYFGLGLGVGHTFTSDSRTDFRTWIYLGPRLLFGLNDW